MKLIRDPQESLYMPGKRGPMEWIQDANEVVHKMIKIIIAFWAFNMCQTLFWALCIYQLSQS